MASISVKERMQLMSFADVWSIVRRIGSLACAFALGWAAYHANGIGILPDTLATVIVGILLIELFRS